MQLFIESENYRTASGNSKLTSLPVSFLYTEAKVSVLCSMLVCWVLSRCTLNRREPSRRILEKSDFNFIQNNLSRICVSVSVRDEPDPLANNLGRVDQVVQDSVVDSLQGAGPAERVQLFFVLKALNANQVFAFNHFSSFQYLIILVKNEKHRQLI